MITVANLTTDQVERVYSGRQGCMCGCLGTYSSDSRQVTRVLNILKKDPRTVVQDGYIVHIDDDKVDRGSHRRRGERNYVVFLKRPDKTEVQS